MRYEITLKEYSGPIEKLLELIEERTLDATDISLARVTEDFLKYLATAKEAAQGEAWSREAKEEYLRTLVDFIVVASQLVLIKSKLLLPALSLSPEEESGIEDLKRRLALYRQVKILFAGVQRMWREAPRQYARAYFLSLAPTALARSGFFYPGQKLSVQTITSAMAAVAQRLDEAYRETQVITEKIISMEEEMNAIIERLRKQGSLLFSSLTSDRSRAEVIVVFLALLHLARDQAISLAQTIHFSDIMVGKNNVGQERDRK